MHGKFKFVSHASNIAQVSHKKFTARQLGIKIFLLKYGKIGVKYATNL
jgi:hypothetical protein